MMSGSRNQVEGARNPSTAEAERVLPSWSGLQYPMSSKSLDAQQYMKTLSQKPQEKKKMKGGRHGSGQSKNKAREYRHGFVWCLEPGPEIASENPQNISGMSVLKGRNLVHCSTSSHSSWLRLRTILFSIWSELVGSSCLPTLLQKSQEMGNEKDT